MKQGWVKTGTGLLAVLFLSYYLSATACYHTHRYNGGTVTHSHFCFPFGNNPAEHNHTPSQYQAIGFLSCIILVCFAAAVFFQLTKVCRIYIPVVCHQTHIHLIALSLRAPPFHW